MPAPRHTSPVPLFSGSIGLNNRLTAHRIPFSEDSGVGGLEVAKNILIDPTGEIVSMKGDTKLLSGSFRDLYPSLTDSASFYVVQERETDAAILLVSIGADKSIFTTGVRSGLPKSVRLSYCALQDSILYSSGSIRGILYEDNSSPWPSQSFTADTTADMQAFPTCTHIDFFSGRVVGSVGSSLYYSEYGLINLYDSVRDVAQFEHPIIGIVAVSTGIFVSTTKGIFFIAGLTPSNWAVSKVADYAMLEYCVHHSLVSPTQYGVDTPGLAGLVGTARGPALLLASGRVKPLADENVNFNSHCSASATSGIMVVEDTLIVQSGE
jgi:hypothetical protein